MGVYSTKNRYKNKKLKDPVQSHRLRLRIYKILLKISALLTRPEPVVIPHILTDSATNGTDVRWLLLQALEAPPSKEGSCTGGQLHRRSVAQAVSCTSGQLHRRSVAQAVSCTGGQLHRSGGQLHRRSVAQAVSCTGGQLHSGSVAQAVSCTGGQLI
jgi:hypothetical protein